MSLHDAKRVLRWQVVTDALTEAGVDADAIAIVEHARHVDDIVHGLVQTLLGSADVKQPKNYVKVEMVGMLPPFERVYVELVRPGGKTSHELRELMRDQLTYVRCALASEVSEAQRAELASGMDDALKLEAP